MVRSNAKEVISILALIAGLQYVSSVKIVMMHMFGGSHYMTTGVLANELVRRGHKVTMLSPEVKRAKETLFESITYYPGFERERLTKQSQDLIQSQQVGMINVLRSFVDFMALMDLMCNSIVDNKLLAKEIESADLLVMESAVFCAPVIAEKYSKPWIAIFPGPLSSFVSFGLRIPLNPSYVPFFMSKNSDDMDFLGRCVNFFGHKMQGIVLPFIINWGLMPFKERMNISFYTDLSTTTKGAEIVIGSCDFALDYPIPLMPNTFCAGPFLVEPANPLPSDWLSYVSGPNGFIVAAFGTVFNTFTREQVRIMATVFGSLQQTVIWQLQDPFDIKVPDNVITMKWLPQNDLLGHHNIRLFISHMGSSSTQQALYHGVPVLATPRAADQWGNAYKLQNRARMAKVINIEKVTQIEFQQSIEDILSDKRYLENAKMGSRRLKTKKQTPMQVAGDLIDYVIDNNYDVRHLKAHALKLPFYVHDLWDIYFFLTAIFIFSLLITYYVFSLIRKIVCRHKFKTE